MKASYLLRTVLVSALAVLFLSCGKQEKENPDNNNNQQQEQPKTETPVIKADAAASIRAAAGTYELAVTVDHPKDGASLSVKVSDEADWITETTADATGVKLTVTDNLSAARQTRLTLSYPEAKDVTVELTQAQWNYSEFGIQISNIGPFGATFDITRKTGYGGGYFFEVLDMSDFVKYVEGEKNQVGDFAYGQKLYESDLAYLNRLSQAHGHPLADLFGMLGSMYSTEPGVKMPYSTLAPDTEYMFIVYGMNNAGERKTPLCLYAFKTGFSTDSALAFSGFAEDVTETYANLVVTPSNQTEYWYLNWVSEIDLKKTTLANVMQNSINNAKSLLGRYTADQILCHGKETVQATGLWPGTEYSVVAWGMNLEMAATTEPKVVFTFKTKEYAIVDDCSFQIEVLDIQDMDVKVRVTPSNPNTRYYVAFVEESKMEGYSDEQAAQRIINMEAQRIDNNYYDVPNLSWMTLPGLDTGVREIWGRRDEGWNFMPSHNYHIYVFGIDNFGIRSTRVARTDVTTAEPMASSNTFQMEVVSNTWLGLDYTITPEIADEYWMTFLAETSDIDTYFRSGDGSLKEKELYAWIEEYYEDELLAHSFSGTRTLHEHVTPNTNYSLIVFGFSGSYTTRMYEYKLYVPEPPLGKSTADFSYTYELFRGEDLSALDPKVWPLADVEGDCIMVMRITPTENAKHWYLGVWGPVENYQEQGGKYYLMMLDMNPDVPGSCMQDKKFWRCRPWWYGLQKDYIWQDEAGDIVKHWPWSISGWAEDADGNYGPWHYELLIPVPLPKDQVTGKYEVGYTQAYNFWSAPASTADMQVFSMSKMNYNTK